MKKCLTLINLIFLCQFIFAFKCFSTEKLILRVESEPEDNQVYLIFLEFDLDKGIQRFKRQQGSNHEIYEFSKIIEGIVLFKMDSRKVLFIKCPNCDLIYGGEIMIRFLKNGITDQYSEIYLDLLKKNDNWGLYKPNGLVPIKSITLRSNKLLGKVIGIKEILIHPQ